MHEQQTSKKLSFFRSHTHVHANIHSVGNDDDDEVDDDTDDLQLPQSKGRKRESDPRQCCN